MLIKKKRRRRELEEKSGT